MYSSVIHTTIKISMAQKILVVPPLQAIPFLAQVPDNYSQIYFPILLPFLGFSVCETISS